LKVKVITLILTLTMLLAAVAYAAIPMNSVIIGNRAFSISYITDPSNAAEIQRALDELGGGPLAYQIEGQTTGWTSIMDGRSLTEEEIAAFPAVIYKDENGESNYGPGDGQEVPDEVKVIARADVAVGSGAMSCFKTITVKPVEGLADAAMFAVSDGATTSAVKALGSPASYMTGAKTVTVTVLAADGATVIATGALNVETSATAVAFEVTVKEPFQNEKTAVCNVEVGSGAMSSFKNITVLSTSGLSGAAKFTVSDGEITTPAKDIGTPATYVTAAESVTVTVLAADGVSVLGTGTLGVRTAASNVTVKLQ